MAKCKMRGLIENRLVVNFLVCQNMVGFAYGSDQTVVTSGRVGGWKVRMRRRRLTSRARLHNNVTMTLITVVSVFVVCELPDAVLRLLVAVDRLATGNDNDVEGWTIFNVDAFIHRAHCLTNVLLAVNSSVNFIIYFLVGNKFREILARQCGCESDTRRRAGNRAGARFLQTPDTGSTAGVDVGSYFVERPDGFVWSSRRAGGGRGFAPRSPTTERVLAR